MDLINFLKSTTPFNNLTEDMFSLLIQQSSTKVFPKNTFVFKQGEPSHQTLYLIYKGLAKIIVTAESQEIIVAFRKPHDFFGETAFLTNNLYPASVKASEDLHCLLISRNMFEYLCQINPSFASFFSQILTERMSSLYKEVVLGQSYEAWGLESNPFRHRLGELMSSPVITCFENDSAHHISKLLNNYSISSLVVLNKDNRPTGIITERDLINKVILNRPNPVTWPSAKEIMNPHPLQLPPTAFYYQGLLTMVKHKCKHILIGDNEEIIGIVTIKDLIKSRSMGALSIIQDLETQSTIKGLSIIRNQVDNVLKALVSEKAPPLDVCEVISEFNDRITKKVIEISEAEMKAEGYGPPPASYCWIVMGSGGRKEQLFTTDQDNALIFENEAPDKLEKNQAYFLKLADKVVAGLEQCGFKRCKGEVMADNTNWCKSFNQWQKTIDDWFVALEGESLKNMSILADLRAIYGNQKLAYLLQRHLLKKFNQVALYHLAASYLEHRVPLNLFKQIVTEKTKNHEDEVNLKASASIHAVNMIKLFALREGISETSTLKRLHILAKKKVFTADNAEYFEVAYQALTMFRLRTNLEKIGAGQEADNYLKPKQLTKRQQSVLRESFLAVAQLQNQAKLVFLNYQ
ncbi:MAG: DUF294 nucleotidyltransferase-like domain-containing protein [Bacillota bacterium]|nr:DUF294 nucleotidyltransferase-like domain-containing protein [Bacillota bacterium]